MDIINNLKHKIKNLPKINSGRQKALDAAKFFVIIIMLTQHTLLMFIDHANLVGYLNSDQRIIAYYIKYIVPHFFGAGIFMFIMGIGFVYSKNQSWKKNILRGFFIFISGYILNFLRFYLPYDIINLLYEYPKEATLIYNDILPFAGLAIMVYQVFRKLKFNDVFIFCFSVLFCIVGYLCKDFVFKDIYTEIFIGIFISTTKSMFPFCFWFCIVMSGTLFGKILLTRKKLNIFYAWTLALSLVFICVYTVCFCIGNSFNSYVDALESIAKIRYDNLLNIALNVCLVIFFVSLCHFLTCILPKFLNRVFYLFSKNLYRIYYISWVILCWACVIVYVWQVDRVLINKLKFEQLFIVSVALIVVSFIFAMIYGFVKGKVKNHISNL